MPARKQKRTPSSKDLKETKQPTAAQLKVEAAKLRLSPGSGWIPENYRYLKTLPVTDITDNIYKMFSIPLMYKNDESRAAIHIFVEFQVESFNFSLQFADITKAMRTIALLNDFIGCVPSFNSSKVSFGEWAEKAQRQIAAFEFTSQETQNMLNYINKNLKTNAHIYHFVLTNDAIQKMDAEGLKLFRPVIIERQETTNEVQEQNPDANSETGPQFALDDINPEQQRQKEEMILEVIEEAMADNYARIQAVIDNRNELILNRMNNIDIMDGSKPTARIADKR